MARPHLPLESLWPAGARLLVAVSGGADSVALLHGLCRRRGRDGLDLTVVHLHHGIRGRAADRDADFVRALAKAWGMPCIVGHARVPAAARRSGESIEMAARRARQAFFRRALRKTGAYAVLTAHTADDQAETVLLRLLRGSGSRGLGGIAPRTEMRGLRVARPLLGASRARIEAYLRAHGIAWREDRSNRDRAIPRNRIRRDLLPHLERRYQPAIRRILCRIADTLREESAMVEPVVARAAARCVDAGGGLSVSRAAALDPGLRHRVALRWLRDRGAPESRLGRDMVRRALSLMGGGGSRAELAAGFSAIREADRLIVVRATARAAPVARALRLRVPGRVEWLDGVALTAERTTGIARPSRRAPGAVPSTATIRPPRRGEVLTVRPPWPGARIAPIGLAGSAKLQDIFVDAKVPRVRRGRVPVVACGDEVVWVPGYRVARRWAVPSEGARSVALNALKEVRHTALY